MKLIITLIFVLGCSLANAQTPSVPIGEFIENGGTTIYLLAPLATEGSVYTGGTILGKYLELLVSPADLDATWLTASITSTTSEGKQICVMSGALRKDTVWTFLRATLAAPLATIQGVVIVTSTPIVFGSSITYPENNCYLKKD